MMSNFRLSSQADPNKIFLTRFSELEGRLDPLFCSIRLSNKNLTPIRNIATIKGGKRIPKGKSFSFENTKYKYLRVKDFNNFHTSNLKNISKELFYFLNRYEVTDKTLVISIAGTIGKTILFKNHTDNRVILTENAAKILLTSDSMTYEFLNISLQTKLLQKQIQSSRTQTTIPKLGIDKILNLKIPIPPKNIQAEIVAKMDKAYQNKQQKEQQAQDLLNSIDGYLLGELGINLPEQTDNNLQSRIFTKKWSDIAGGRFDAISAYMQKYEYSLLNGKTKVIKLKNIILNIKTGSTPHNNLNPYTDNGIPFLRNTNIDNSFIDLSNVKFIKDGLKNKLTYSNKNDVIICIAGTVGNSAINTYGKLSINQNITSLTLDKNEVNPEFLNCYFNSELSVRLVKKQCSIATILYINNDNLLNLYIPLPPIEKQNQIAKYISQIRDQAKKLQSEAKSGLGQAKQQVEIMILGGEK